MNLGIHKKGIIVILTILLSFCACFNAFAQDDTWFYDKPISKIVFDGLVHVNREEVTAVTNQYLGKDFTDMLYSELISKIYALELFEEIIPDGRDDMIIIIPEFAFFFGTIDRLGAISRGNRVRLAIFIEEI